MAGIEEFALGVIASLVANVLSSESGFAALPYFKREKIRRRVEIATADVVEPLLPFLSNEGLTKVQQELLFRACTEELQPFTHNSQPLFSGSLDGQKIFDNMYAGKELPQAIRDEGLESIYALLCPRIATLLCRLPTAVKDWETNAWTENFSRLDIIAAELRELFVKLDTVDQLIFDSTSGVLFVVRRSLAQRVSMNLDLTGLRADTPVAGKMSDFFVHPEIARIENKEVAEAVSSGNESLCRFTRKDTLAVVFGSPGSGKSTWSRWLQKELLTSAWPGLAVRVELRRLSMESLPSVYDLIRQAVTVHVKEELTVERIQEWIRGNNIVFLLDGFDEISPAHRETVRNWIVEMAEVLKPCPVLITSRPLTTDHLRNLPDEWLRWDIMPFDDARILEYIKRWYSNMPLLTESAETSTPERLAAQLSGDPTIVPLKSNPLLLSTLLMVHHLDGSLPSGRAQLYRRYVDGMLGVWDARRKVATVGVALVLAEKRHILTDLAVHMQLRQRDQIDEDEAADVTRKCLNEMRKQEDATEVLASLRERSGLIVGPGTYSFIHKSVAEFLVADAAVQGSYIDASGTRIDRFALFQHRADDRWNVVIFLWAGLAPVIDVEAFIEQCKGVDDIPLGYGILDDQYDRFPPHTKRRLVLRLRYVNNGLHDGIHFWACNWQKKSTVKDETDLVIPSLELRGLQHRMLPNILFRAVVDHLLLWSDAKGTCGQMRVLIWMSVASSSTDIRDWSACIKKLPVGLSPPDPDRWMFWLASYTVRATFYPRTTTRDTKAYIRVFCKAHPGCRGFITLAAVDALVEYTMDKQDEMASPEEMKRRLLDLLSLVDWRAVPPERLIGTHNWVIDRPGTRRGIDLLSAALRELKSWHGDPLLNAEKLAATTTSLSELIANRPCSTEQERSSDK